MAADDVRPDPRLVRRQVAALEADISSATDLAPTLPRGAEVESVATEAIGHVSEELAWELRGRHAVLPRASLVRPGLVASPATDPRLVARARSLGYAILPRACAHRGIGAVFGHPDHTSDLWESIEGKRS
ncbi:MAG: hypothetical protein ACK5IM_11120, partial [Demequina sp.]|uniref:hypothetical protein n=1 Tax=Demequina sp. TaxID=2050685 RepID=UPI003A86DC31